jgi:truncated hemoglobin YjbI
MTQSLYDRIGEDFIRRAITEFYRRAETDGIIGHFFFGKDLPHIIAQQIDFASNMLGGPKVYRGKPLRAAHAQLRIGLPHFGRRQMLMAEVLKELALDAELAKAWLDLEEQLKPLIFGRR